MAEDGPHAMAEYPRKNPLNLSYTKVARAMLESRESAMC
jgi:hypothetical protein